MFKKICCLILILKLTQARYDFVPKFYGEDSAIIVDTDKTFTPTRNMGVNYKNNMRIPPPPFPLWRHFPRYHIVPPPPPAQILAINTWANLGRRRAFGIPTTKSTTTSTTTTTTTTTTAKPIINNTIMAATNIDGEYPIELLSIAQSKLGLSSPDEVPSLSELGQLLGTDTPEQTLNYMRKLTSNDQGIALLKAYIESTDYTDNTGDSSDKNYDMEDEEDGDVNEPNKVNDEGLIVITDEDSNDDYELNNDREQPEAGTNKPIVLQSKTTNIVQKLDELPQTATGFIGRIANYMHANDLYHRKEDNDNVEYVQMSRMVEHGKRIPNKLESQPEENESGSEMKRNHDAKTPLLLRDPIPFNYPVPIRVQTTRTTTTTSHPSNTRVSSHTPVLHLNTPKMLIPYVNQLARVTSIPPTEIQNFLKSKPKLLELVTKVSHFPMSYDRSSPIEHQILTALQKAFKEDADLEKLLSSTTTLQ